MAKPIANGQKPKVALTPSDELICGIVMPISSADDCPAAHWVEVLDIVRTAAENVGFNARLVSSEDVVGVILKRIVQNLYNDPIVICDVSTKNANVMFELGLRLAFDKPTIIIKDDRTGYAFDTSVIEHLEYPRDLRCGKIIDFKEKLGASIRATHQKANSDGDFSTFLKHFGSFKVAAIETKQVPGEELILDEMREIRAAIQRMVSRGSTATRREEPPPKHGFEFDLVDADYSKLKSLTEKIEPIILEHAGEYKFSNNRIRVELPPDADPAVLFYMADVVLTHMK